jgi:hypothetical protein
VRHQDNAAKIRPQNHAVRRAKACNLLSHKSETSDLCALLRDTNQI